MPADLNPTLERRTLDALTALRHVLAATLRPLAELGNGTYACDIVHDRLASIDAVRAILASEDDDLRAVLETLRPC